MDTHCVPPRVVVVGGGLAGLTTSAYLARAGMPVQVFDKATNVGGRATTTEFDGYQFNRGIHALDTGGATTQVLQEFGIHYTAGSPETTCVLRQGTWSPFPTSPLALFRSRLFNMAEKLELVRVLATLPRLNATAFGQISIQEWLDTAIRHPRVRQLLAATARTLVYSAALDLVSADVLLDKLQRTLKQPVHYLDGGWQTLVDALRMTAEETGAHITSSTRVEAVVHANGHVQGVRLFDGRFVPAQAVVIATTPRQATQLIDGGAYPPLRDCVARLIPAQLACLDVAVRQLPASPYTIVQDVEQPRFFSTQSRYARVAPAGGALVHCFKQLDPRVHTDPHDDTHELEGLLDTALPGWRDHVVNRIVLPRIEAVGMLPLARDGGMAGRPASQVPGLHNCYLVGDWIGDAGFLADTSMSSTRRVAQLVLDCALRAHHTPTAQHAQPAGA